MVFPRFTYLARSHHHATTDSVERVRSDTSTSGDSPAEKERNQEVTLEGTGEEDRLERVVHSEVETTVNDDTSDRGTETTVETEDTVRCEGLLVDIDQTVELSSTTALRVLVVVGKTGTGVVEGVHKEEGSGTSELVNRKHMPEFDDVGNGRTYTTGGQVTSHPPSVSITLLLVTEHGLEGVAESEVQGLGWEVTENVGSVSTPERGDTLLSGDTLEALANAGVWAVKTTTFKHLIL
jgi:hypothetical protein